MNQEYTSGWKTANSANEGVVVDFHSINMLDFKRESLLSTLEKDKGNDSQNSDDLANFQSH